MLINKITIISPNYVVKNVSTEIFNIFFLFCKQNKWHKFVNKNQCEKFFEKFLAMIGMYNKHHPFSVSAVCRKIIFTLNENLTKKFPSYYLQIRPLNSN